MELLEALADSSGKGIKEAERVFGLVSLKTPLFGRME
jgi:hypothetical protein